MPNDKKKLTPQQLKNLSKVFPNLSEDELIKLSGNVYESEGSFIENELKRIRQQSSSDSASYKKWQDKGGNYYIHDKQTDHVIKTDVWGNVLATTPAIRGTVKGDKQNSNNTENINQGTTTPSFRGRFMKSGSEAIGADDPAPNEYPLGFYSYNEGKNLRLGLHQVYTKSPNRWVNLLTPEKTKCNSFGCSNVPDQFIKENAPTLDVDSMIVTPEPKISNTTDWSVYDNYIPGFSKQTDEYINYVNTNFSNPPIKQKRLQKIRRPIENISSIDLRPMQSLQNRIVENIPNKMDMIIPENNVSYNFADNIFGKIKNIVSPQNKTIPINNDIFAVDKENELTTLPSNIPEFKGVNGVDEYIKNSILRQPELGNEKVYDKILAKNIKTPIQDEYDSRIEREKALKRNENTVINNNPNDMPTINDIIKDMQTPDEENKRGVVSANKPDDNLDWIRELILKESLNSNKLLDSIPSEPIKQQLMMLNNGLDIPNMLNNGLDIPNNIYPPRPTKNFSTMDIFGNIDEPINYIKTKPISFIPLDNNFNIPSFNTGNSIKNKSEAQDEQTLMDQIVSANNSYRKRMNALNAMKAVDSASSLLNNLLEGDGITPIESTHLISPEMKYDDTIRRAIASEASKSGQIAQSNAMKLGMGAMIPAIQNNVLRSTNEANTQAQAQLNQIEQQNASTAAQTANNEQQIFIQQRDKIIQDALLKNASRQQAIGQSKDALWKDITRGIEQNQLYKDADMQAKVYEYMKKYPGADADQLMAFINRNAYTKKKGTSDNSSDEDLIKEFLNEFLKRIKK